MTKPLPRRTFLRATGVAIGLPLLDAMLPRLAFGDQRKTETARPRRMLAIMTNMGIMPEYFFPTGEGRNYELSPYLQELTVHRDDFTVFSGLSHPEMNGAHASEVCFLTAAPHPGSGGFRNTISLDQYAAERIGSKTRFPYLSLTIGKETDKVISWTASGGMVPSESSPSEVYKKLFAQGSKAEIAAQVDRLRKGRSILDVVSDRAHQLQQRVGSTDRQKLDQYFSSVRQMEQRLHESQQWEHRPKPQVDVSMPKDIRDKNDLIGRSRQMFDMVRLAFETDSTRIITVKIHENNEKVNLPGVTQAHHSLTHHGSRPEMMEQLKTIETAQMQVFSELLLGLKESREGGETMLDRTMVLNGSNLGNANGHSNRNLPILLAGGGFRHGQHLVFDRNNNTPLPNLYVSMLHRLGIETDRFASSSGSLRGLELA